MAGPPVAVAAVRTAIRRALADLSAGDLVLVACSGGADSLALAVAVAHEQRRAPWRAGLVTVDHGLQPGSADRARRLAAWARLRDLDPAEVLTVQVGRAGGREAAARAARYVALDDAVARLGAAAVLLGHTLEDQAETVLLGLARGSGARSLAGMASVRGAYRRPLLERPHDLTRAVCLAEGVPTWEDPHNRDDAFTRVRLRGLLDALEQAAPGAIGGLARSAQLLRADADALDSWARRGGAEATDATGALDCATLAGLPAAVRTRVLHAAALVAGASAGGLGSVHVHALDDLVCHWSGQGPVMLPAGVCAARVSGRLTFGRLTFTPPCAGPDPEE